MKPFSLDKSEHNIFSQWSYTHYYTMLYNNTGLPDDTSFKNTRAGGDTYNIPDVPGPYEIQATRIPGLFYSWFGTSLPLTEEEVKANVTAAIDVMRIANNSTVTTPPEFVRFKDNSPFKLVVDAGAIKNGFYDKLYNRKSTSLCQRGLLWVADLRM